MKKSLPLILPILLAIGCATPQPPTLSKTKRVEVYSPELTEVKLAVTQNGPYRKQFHSKARSTGNILTSDVTVKRKQESVVVGSERVQAGSNYNIHSKQTSPNYVTIDVYKHSWLVDGVSATPVVKQASTQPILPTVSLYRHGQVSKKSEGRLSLKAKPGEVYTKAYSGRDVKPSMQQVFGEEYSRLETDKLKYSRIIVKASAETPAADVVSNNLVNKFDSFITDLKPSEFEALEIAQEKGRNASSRRESQAMIFYSIGYSDALTAAIKKLIPQYREIKFEVYDALTHLPVNGIKLKIEGINNALYSKAYYYQTTGFGAMKPGIIRDELERNIKPEWFANSAYQETYNNGQVLRFNNSTIKLSLRTLHNDYVSFSSAVTLKPKNGTVKVFVDRVGTISREASRVKGGRVSVE